MYICICVYMYICIYVYMYVYMYISIYVYTYIRIYVYTYICLYVYMYICIYVYMYICIYVYMYICIYVYMYICIYVYMYICIYVYMYICIGVNRYRGKFVNRYIFVYMYTCIYSICIYRVVVDVQMYRCGLGSQPRPSGLPPRALGRSPSPMSMPPVPKKAEKQGPPPKKRQKKRQKQNLHPLLRPLYIYIHIHTDSIGSHDEHTTQRLPVEDHTPAGEPPGSVCIRGAAGLGYLASDTLPSVSREWKNGSGSSYNCTPFLHSLLTKGKIQVFRGLQRKRNGEHLNPSFQ